MQAINKGQLAAINRLLMIFIVACGVSFNVIDSPFFADFLQLLRPNYSLPGIFLRLLALTHQSKALTITSQSICDLSGRRVVAGRLLQHEVNMIDSQFNSLLLHEDAVTLSLDG